MGLPPHFSCERVKCVISYLACLSPKMVLVLAHIPYNAIDIVVLRISMAMRTCISYHVNKYAPGTRTADSGLAALKMAAGEEREEREVRRYGANSSAIDVQIHVSK